MNKEDLIIITGGSGFIGSNLLKELNNVGYNNILIVDDFSKDKWRNLVGCKFKHSSIEEFKNLLKNGVPYRKISTVFHLGAISDTTFSDDKIIMENNFDFSVLLFNWCAEHKIEFHYASSASVYGNKTDGTEEPLNLYAFSKWRFDEFVKHALPESKAIVPPRTFGLRYFNVYGPNEFHKQGQSSPILSFYNQLKTQNKIKLFDISEGRRDFVSVKDVCDVHIWLMENSKIQSNIFDVGTGNQASFYDVAIEIWDNCGRGNYESLAVAPIEWIKFPEYLEGKYQYYSKADLKPLRSVGYTKEFVSLKQGTKDYIDYLKLKGK